MLKLLPYDAVSFDSGMVLNDAYNVRVTREINGTHMLEFSHPSDEKSELISENKIVVCGGQAYRIIKVVRSRGDNSMLEAECHHVYNADAPNIHLQNVPDMIGVNPSDVLSAVFDGTKFSLMTDSEIEKLGMKRVDYDGFEIDFFSTDKTNPYDVMKTLIESCGKGEIYTDNYKVALVERIGNDTAIRLDLSKNMRSISVERDMTDVVTRLYPYGKDDAHIGSVNDGVQYIESAMADIYGVREGYRDYSDYSEPSKIMRRALWEFDSQNEERIDVPCVNITGTFADISKLAEFGEAEKLAIGDTVTVSDNGAEITERVIRTEYYPYQSDSSVISVGRVKKDLFFYLEQMGELTRRYKKISAAGGKVRAQSIAGVISSAGVNIKSSAGTLSILTDMLKISTGNVLKAQIGNQNGSFVFNIADNSGNTAIKINSEGKMEFVGNLNASEIKVGANVISVNENGALCINDKEISVKE